MKVTVLGCGASIGVPMLGNDWGRCNPDDPRNRRRRCSILIENRGFVLLVDTSPDLREQLLAAEVHRIDAVLYTHGHADHTHGVDDLRALYWRMQRPIDVHGDAATLAMLHQRFGYMFSASPDSPPHFLPPLVAHEIGEEPFELAGITIRPFRQDHGSSGTSLGFLFDDRFAYSTDVAVMTAADLARLRGLDLWIVDCLREGPSAAHANLALALSWIRAVQPRRAYLTHMAADLDYEWVASRCPEGVAPAHDGLVLEI